MQRVKLTALITTVLLFTTMILPATTFANESNTPEAIAPSEHKELTFNDMYMNYQGLLMQTTGASGSSKVDTIIDGYSDGTFRPYGTVTKAEVAVIIADSMEFVFNEWDAVGGVAIPKPVMTYKDIDKSMPEYTAIQECYEAGVFTDAADGLFRPNKVLTQAEAVTMLASRVDKSKVSGALYARRESADVVYASTAPMREAIYTNPKSAFLKPISNHWAVGKYSLLVHANVFRESEIKLAPNEPISRIDLVCMLENLFWYELPQIESFVEQEEAAKRKAITDRPELLYYVSNISNSVRYTEKFSDISELKDYQKYALTRCVEK